MVDVQRLTVLSNANLSWISGLVESESEVEACVLSESYLGLKENGFSGCIKNLSHSMSTHCCHYGFHCD